MLEDVDGLRAVAVDVNGSTVHLCQGLDLQVVPVDVTPPLPPHILGKVLRHVLGEVVCISLLEYRNILTKRPQKRKLPNRKMPAP